METIIDQEDNSKKIAGIFNDEAKAQQAVDAVKADSDLVQADVKLVSPSETHFGKKVEPEDKNMSKSFLNRHIAYAGFGLVIGLIASTILMFLNLGFMQNFIIETYAAISVICIFMGLLAAGFVSVRPDHDPLINDVRQAAQAGKWIVIVHTDHSQKVAKAKNLMQPFAQSTSSTF